MSDNLKKHFRDLEFVSKIKCPKTKKALMKYIAKDPKAYVALREIALNIIEGNVTMDKKTKNRLSKHKKTIYGICKQSKVSAKERKKLVIQSGGWLWILPLVTSAIDLII